MKNKNHTIIDKSDIMTCWKCNGTGFGNVKEIECPLCKGTGKFRESHYIIIDEKIK